MLSRAFDDSFADARHGESEIRTQTVVMLSRAFDDSFAFEVIQVGAGKQGES